MNEVSARGALTLSSAEVCDRGKVREENQDNVRSARIPLGELLIVADGIGGYQGGATASRLVVEGFLGQLATRPADAPPERALKEASVVTNTSIFSTAGSSDPTLQRMGSTVVLALIQLSTPNASEAVAWIGHIGDSRAYLVRNGQMQKITSDHSAVQSLLSRKLITEEEARNHPDASVLTRSMGHRPEVEIEIDRVSLQAGDALLLCSDGLWGYVSDADIAAVVTDQSLAVQTIADALLHQALAAGGQDNIGIQFARLSGASPVPAPGPQPASQTLKATRARQSLPLQWIALVFLLLAACGLLGYLAVNHNWFNINALLNRQSPQAVRSQPPAKRQPAPRNPNANSAATPDAHQHAVTPAPVPAETPVPTASPLPPRSAHGKTVAVVGDLQAGAHELNAAPQSANWQRISITRDNSPACVNHAKSKPAIYAEPNVDMAAALVAVVELKLSVGKVEQHRMTAEIKRDCGSFDAIVFLPNKVASGPNHGPADQAPDTPAQPNQDPRASAPSSSN